MAKILVIDDEKSIRNTLKEILEYENHSVDLAVDGIEGSKLIKKSVLISIIETKIAIWNTDRLESLASLCQL